MTVLYRGARYELGRGPGFYGIWLTGAPQSQPFEWWHETPRGLVRRLAPADHHRDARHHHAGGPSARPAQLPSRLTRLPSRLARSAQPGPAVQPGPVTQPGQPSYGQPGQARAGTSTQAITASALLAGGVLAGLIGLFPSYVGGQSLASVASNLVPHVIYLLAWLAAAVLLLLGGGRQRAGALLAAGVSVVTLGLFLADLGTVMSGGAHLLGGGLVLSFLGWLLATAGAVMALWLPPVSWPARPRGSAQLLTLGLATVIAIGAAIAFAPSWDSFTVREPNGTLHHFTAGNAFANPGPVIAADVIVMILFVAVVVVAALWRPVREGAVLLAAAIVPFLAQAISAPVQLAQAASLQFGLTPAQAAREGLTITSGLTAAFWIYCVLVAALIALCAWMFVPRRPVPPGSTAPAPVTTMS